MNHVGVSLKNDMTYSVEKDSEVAFVLEALFNKGKLRSVPLNKRGEFCANVDIEWGNCSNPFKAFIRAFYADCPTVEIPRDFGCMETAAWTMAEVAYMYQEWNPESGNHECDMSYFDRKSHFYDYSMHNLEKLWGKTDDHWKEIVFSMFPSSMSMDNTVLVS